MNLSLFDNFFANIESFLEWEINLALLMSAISVTVHNKITAAAVTSGVYSGDTGDLASL